MSHATLKLSKNDVRQALIKYQLQTGDISQIFDRIRSVQFDPLQPVGCNHDLVLQARVEGYKVGDWKIHAYDQRKIYDGWDKQASLIPFSGWHARRIFHKLHEAHFKTIFNEYEHAITAVLEELEKRGPLTPKEFDFQERNAEWKSHWYSPNVTKRALRALWHTGRVMTHGRRGQHHVYDLTERVVPGEYLTNAPMTDQESLQQILLDRHKAIGILRPTASYEVWAINLKSAEKNAIFKDLVEQKALVKVDVEGTAAHATPEFLSLLETSPAPKRVVFLGPLDQIMWDRKMVNHLFGFDYIWEVYKPESQRKWGYYVLPVLNGDRFVARFDSWCRAGVLEIKAWHWEPDQQLAEPFFTDFAQAMKRFMDYCDAKTITFPPGTDPRLQESLASLL